MAIQALLVILAVLLVLLFLGVPISYAIAVSSLTAILSSIDLNVAVLTAAQRTFVGMSKFSLTAIPFFILAGNIMNPRRDRCHQRCFLLLRFADPAVQRLDHLLAGIRRHLCGCAVHGWLHSRHHLGAVLLRGGRAAGGQAGL